MSTTKRRVLSAGGAWVARALRVTVAVVLVAAAFLLVAARVSYARATQAAIDFGEQLRQLGEHHMSGDLNGEAYEVVLNGQSIQANNAVTTRPMHEVLTFFQDQCHTDALGMADRLAHLEPTLRDFAPATGVPGMMTVRREQADSGFVFCMATDHVLDKEEQLQHLKRGASGDLGRVGDVRYVSVRKEGDHASVVAAWTHGTFDVKAMFPDKGDVPGVDLGNVPRPDGSRRILSGVVAGAAYGVNAYAVPGERDTVLAAVNGKLLAAGWTPLPVPKETAQTIQFYTMANNVDLGVTASSARQGMTDVNYVVSKGIGTVTK